MAASIEALRAEIDRLDDRLVMTLAARVEACLAIGAIKSETGVPVMQEDRVSTVKTRCAARAGELGIDSAFVMSLYDLIISHACDLETAGQIKKSDASRTIQPDGPSK